MIANFIFETFAVVNWKQRLRNIDIKV